MEIKVNSATEKKEITVHFAAKSGNFAAELKDILVHCADKLKEIP